VTRPNDRGSITLWTLGLTLCLLVIAGLSTDLWRAFGVRQRLAQAADAAAIAGATALDEPALRTQGTYQLDPHAAEQRALQHLAAESDAALVTAAAAATPNRVTIRVQGKVHFTLLRILTDDPLDITVTASAAPARGAP
jgi:VCBS repeat-containing protein